MYFINTGWTGDGGFDAKLQEQSQCKCNQSRRVSLTDLSFNYQISAVKQVTPAEFRAETLKQPQELESKPSTPAPQPPCPSFDALQAILLSPTHGGRQAEIAIYQTVTIFYARQLHGHKPRSIPQPHNEGYNWKSDFITTEKTFNTWRELLSFRQQLSHSWSINLQANAICAIHSRINFSLQHINAR
ncbi:hypothetical protein FF1_001710 [Malus domestica]